MSTYNIRTFILFVIIYHSCENKLYLYLAECNTAFGLEEGGIEDGQLSALSYYESFSNGDGEVFPASPHCARKDHHYCAWCAESAIGQYLEVDLRSNVLITGIATQGFETLSGAYFVTKYTVGFSGDKKTWKVLPVSINLISCEISNNDDCDDYRIF